MSASAQPDATSPPSKGRVLFVGASYYNNWYLSRELRQLGWQADTFMSSTEGAESYAHGVDYYFTEWEWLAERPALEPGVRERLEEFSEEYVRWVRQFAPGQRGERWQPLRPDRPDRAAYPTAYTGWAQRWQKHVGQMSMIDLFDAMQVEAYPPRLRQMLRRFLAQVRHNPHPKLLPLFEAADRYDIVHFTGVNNLRWFCYFHPVLFGTMPIGWDLDILKRLGTKIVYSHTGCLDGVSQSAFSRWGPDPVCRICRWRNEPTVCSDERNLAWGALRNYLADYQILLGGNRVDYNDDPRVHEVPEFYCLDPDVWRPDLEVPDKYRLPSAPGTVRIYHAVGNYNSRTNKANQVNVKTTHVIVPTVERLKAEGYPVELVFCTDVPNRDVRFFQLQSDIVVDMLTFGFFGANVREALMLGKPAICFLRPEWLQSMRAQVPDYVDELPVVSATPATFYRALVDLVTHPEKRAELGRRGREFALRWHSRQAAGRRFDRIYSDLIAGPLRARAA